MRPFRAFGHRGAKAYAPENTLAAFAKALELGATGIELDVHLSLDGHIVVIHDADVSRTTDGRGRIGELSLDEIKRFDAGVRFDSQFAGERVPVLDEVLELVAGRALINVELKKGEGLYRDLPERLAEFLIERDAVEQVVLSSFEREYLKQMKAVLPAVEVALLFRDPELSVVQEAAEAGWESLHPSNVRAVTPELVAAAHAQGLTVRSFNPKEPEQMRRLIGMGVDAVGSDYPDRIVAVARELGVWPS